ncbi:hypothetical protein PSENEW3_00002555 [Picochlorum sp. SENEW3]|nr:hypothetical protein PSENEW3_00002555 [Picochlorum sp. SENEW3]
MTHRYSIWLNLSQYYVTIDSLEYYLTGLPAQMDRMHFLGQSFAQGGWGLTIIAGALCAVFLWMMFLSDVFEMPRNRQGSQQQQQQQRRRTTLCDDSNSMVDITDTNVLDLVTRIPVRPEFSLAEAWFKCEAARYGKAPEEIPANLLDSFTLNGSIPVRTLYFDQAYLGGDANTPVWTTAAVNDLMYRVAKRQQTFNYDTTPIYTMFDARPDLVRGQRGLVIGSENPWLEALLLFYGAREVNTLEFGSIESKDERIKTFTPDQFKVQFLRGNIRQYDFAFTYSSIEHDGLGRYGDVLHPNGDLLTMAKLLSIVKPGGVVMVGVPCCHDRLDWNAHRIYGPIRLQKVFSGYKVLGVYPKDARMGQESTEFSFQPVWLLKNQLACDDEQQLNIPRIAPTTGL